MVWGGIQEMPHYQACSKYDQESVPIQMQMERIARAYDTRVGFCSLFRYREVGRQYSSNPSRATLGDQGLTTVTCYMYPL
jgi:hypothetical protein